MHPGYAKKPRQHMRVELLTSTFGDFFGTGSDSVSVSIEFLTKKFIYKVYQRVLYDNQFGRTDTFT